jgi:dTMP kinase
MNTKGKYIVIEGQDGTGKTTQLNLLAEYFRSQSREVAIINEGAETNSGLDATDQIDVILHNKNLDLDPLTNVLIFTAGRRELWMKIAKPTLERDGIVLASRNWFSTLAYQHFGQGIDKAIIERVTQEFLPQRYMSPDYSFILTLPDSERSKRIKIRGNNTTNDAFESRGDDFQIRVNNGYLEIA